MSSCQRRDPDGSRSAVALLAMATTLALLPTAPAQSVSLAWRQTVPDLQGRAVAVAVSDTGDVTVAGHVQTRVSDETARNIVLARFNAAGTPQWTVTYGASTRDEFPSAIHSDREGATWVAGSVSDPSIVAGGSGYRVLLLHYGPDGVRRWAAQFGSGISHPRGLHVDESGHAYLIAESLHSNGSEDGTIPGTVVARFSPQGEILWERTVAVDKGTVSPRGLAPSAAGGVEALGSVHSADGLRRAFRVRLDVDGQASPMRMITGEHPPDYQPAWILPSSSGVTFVVGVAAFVDPPRIGPGSAPQDGIVVDAAGLDGAALGTSRHLPTSGWRTYLGATAPTPAGGIVATARIRTDQHEPARDDMITVQFGADGTLQWAARHAGPRARQDLAMAVAVDAAGAVYSGGVGVQVGPDAMTTSLLLAKHSPLGTRLWVAPEDLGGVTALAVSPAGDVFAAGFVGTWGGPSELMVAKYTQTADPAAPRIAIEPPAAEGRPGETVALRAVAEGPEPASFQWYHFGEPIPGATNRSLVLDHLQWDHQGDYAVAVLEDGHAWLSPEARVTVRLPPVVAGMTGDRRVVAGRPVEFAISATGDTPMRTQWFRQGVPIPGANQPTLRLDAVAPGDAGAYHAEVHNDWGIASSGKATLDIVPANAIDRWGWRHPLPQGNDLTAAAHGRGRYLAVGIQGALISSPDAVTWTSHPREHLGDLHAVVSTGDRFVGVRAQQDLLVSLDGAEWVRARLPGTFQITSLAHGNGVLVAAGWDILTSSNGLDWEAVWHLPAGHGIRSMAFGRGRFVAIPEASTSYVLVSDRGTDWQTVGTSYVQPSSSLIRSITFGDGVFLALNEEGQPYSSPDGTTWTRQDAPAGIRISAVAGGKGVLAGVGRDVRDGVGGDAQRTRILRCLDGRTWTTNDLQLGNNLHHLTYAGDRFLALGDDGHLLVSPDGASWTLIAPSSDLNLEAVAEGGGRWVAVGDQGRILHSPDGHTWRAAGAVPVSSRFNDVAHGAGRFVAVSDGGDIVTSVDGTHWTRVGTGGWPGLQAILHVRGRFVIAGNIGLLATSTDGLAWTSVPGEPSQTLRALAASQDRIVAVGDNVAAVSTNGVDWLRVPQSPGFRARCVAFGNGHFLAPQTTGTAWASTNGVDWVALGSEGGRAFRDVLFAAGRFIACGSGGRIWTSTDGDLWLEHYSSGANDLRDLLWTGNGTLLAVGNNLSILESGLLVPRLGLPASPRGTRLLEIAVPAGGDYRLQATESLPASAWVNLLDLGIAPRDRTVFWEDREAGTARFYRVTEVP